MSLAFDTYDRITPAMISACVPTCTQVAFRRRQRDFVVWVPGDLRTPDAHVFNVVWRVELDGEPRILSIVADAGRYLNVRRRTLEKHNGTLTKLASIAIGSRDRINYKRFGSP